MLRVLILLHDANDHGRTRVLEEVKIVNDGSGDARYGNYDVTRFSDWNGVSGDGRVVGFERSNGAYALAQVAMQKLN